MTQLISAEAAKNSGLSLESAKTHGMGALEVAGGMLLAHNVGRFAKKQDSLMFNGAMTIAALAAAMLVKQPDLKLLAIGAAGYSGIKTLGLSVKAATEPGTAGLGAIPENIKAQIRNYLPLLGIEDAGSTETETIMGLDDVTTEEANAVVVNGPEEELLGLGNALPLM